MKIKYLIILGILISVTNVQASAIDEWNTGAIKNSCTKESDGNRFWCSPKTVLRVSMDSAVQANKIWEAALYTDGGKILLLCDKSETGTWNAGADVAQDPKTEMPAYTPYRCSK